jgi:signal transduction histidine kinase
MDPVRDRPRDRLVDLGLGLCVTGLVALAISVDLRERPGAVGASPPAYLFAVGMGAVILARRRHPVPVLLASAGLLVGYYMLDFPVIGLAVPMAAALFSAAEAGRLRWAVAVAAILLVLSTYVRVREGDSAAVVLGFDLASTGGLLAATIALGDAVRSRRALRAETARRIRQAEAERETETARRIGTERLRIARELHDVLAHTVSVISIQAGVAAEALPADPDAAGRAIGEIRTASRDALTELRTTVRLLRGPDPDTPEAPVAGLDGIDRVVGAAEKGGLAVRVEVSGEPCGLPVVVDTAAHRIVQEAVTNVLRHAKAHAVLVELAYAPESLTVRVTDDGRGPAPGAPGGFGLRGMRERAELLGGRLEAGPAPGGGFRVEAVFPLRPGARQEARA